jgi:hypothetical protein
MPYTCPISLDPIGPNHNEVHVGNAKLVFSYNTLVGVRSKFGPKVFHAKTNVHHSKTTSKHLNKSGFKDAEEVSPEELAKLVHDAMN